MSGTTFLTTRGHIDLGRVASALCPRWPPCRTRPPSRRRSIQGAWRVMAPGCPYSP